MTKGHSAGTPFYRGHQNRGRNNRGEGGFPEGVLLDDADRAALGAFKWSIDGHGYVQRHHRIAVGRYTKIKLHVEIMGFPTVKVDHINGNRLDNRRCNLRLVDDQAHAQNQARSSANTSGYRGVSWSRSARKWYAYANRPGDGRMISLGLYEDVHEAGRVAREYREQHYRGYVNR